MLLKPIEETKEGKTGVQTSWRFLPVLKLIFIVGITLASFVIGHYIEKSIRAQKKVEKPVAKTDKVEAKNVPTPSEGEGVATESAKTEQEEEEPTATPGPTRTIQEQAIATAQEAKKVATAKAEEVAGVVQGEATKIIDEVASKSAETVADYVYKNTVGVVIRRLLEMVPEKQREDIKKELSQ
jgi:hypothetical protein